MDDQRSSHLEGRVVVITGGGGGFGRLIAEMAAARGARIVVGDVDVADGRRRLTLDLSDVTFLDSTGLGIVVGRLKRLARHGGTMTVAAAHERVLRVFTITGLDQLLEIHPDLESAVAAAAAASPRSSAAGGQP